jgi:hypothetical protein
VEDSPDVDLVVGDDVERTHLHRRGRLLRVGGA